MKKYIYENVYGALIEIRADSKREADKWLRILVKFPVAWSFKEVKDA